MTSVGLDHVSVSVADLDRSLAFYHDLLGIPILGRGEETAQETATITGLEGARFRYADLDLGSGQVLELLQYLSPKGTPLKQRVYDPGSGHLALRVEDIDAVLAKLKRTGVVARSEPVKLEEPAWWRGARCAYVSDPDGVAVELVERTKHT